MTVEAILAPERQTPPAVSLTLPSGTFGAKELRRILVVQLVIQLTGGVSDPDAFIAYAHRVERYLEGGLLGRV